MSFFGCCKNKKDALLSESNHPDDDIERSREETTSPVPTAHRHEPSPPAMGAALNAPKGNRLAEDSTSSDASRSGYEYLGPKVSTTTGNSSKINSSASSRRSQGATSHARSASRSRAEGLDALEANRLSDDSTSSDASRSGYEYLGPKVSTTTGNSSEVNSSATPSPLPSPFPSPLPSPAKQEITAQTRSPYGDIPHASPRPDEQRQTSDQSGAARRLF